MRVHVVEEEKEPPVTAPVQPVQGQSVHLRSEQVEALVALDQAPEAPEAIHPQPNPKTETHGPVAGSGTGRVHIGLEPLVETEVPEQVGAVRTDGTGIHASLRGKLRERDGLCRERAHPCRVVETAQLGQAHPAISLYEIRAVRPREEPREQRRMRR